eukprot:4471327-Alexandrium_andersonii.AAC.1
MQLTATQCTATLHEETWDGLFGDTDSAASDAEALRTPKHEPHFLGVKRESQVDSQESELS